MKTQDSGIVYILGAGASTKALPVVNEMIQRLKVFYLTYLISSYFDSLGEDDNQRREKMLHDLKLFLSKIEGKRSIDTYAKELYIKGDKLALGTLKAILGAYLLFEEMFSDEELRTFFGKRFPSLRDRAFLDMLQKPTFPNFSNSFSEAFLNSLNNDVKSKLKQPGNSGPEYMAELKSLEYLFGYDQSSQRFKNDKERIDSRYINFLIDIMERVDVFPAKIKIFSWNYDTQFLLAVKDLNFKIPLSISGEEFSFLKRLNGIAGKKDISPVASKIETIEEKLIECSMFF